MLPSFHDDYLVSYEVNCETRRIKLHVRSRESELANRIVVFTGVEGYRFENDAFGNIIFSLELISVEQLMAEYGSDISKSFRMAGAPGPWAVDLAAAAQAGRARLAVDHPDAPRPRLPAALTEHGAIAAHRADGLLV